MNKCARKNFLKFTYRRKYRLKDVKMDFFEI